MAWPAAVLPCFISRFLYRPLILRQARPAGADVRRCACPPGRSRLAAIPQTPRTGVQQVCLFCLMDKSTSGMDMWTRQSLDHIPTSEHLTTGATPSA